jgi:hypothetical protein
MGTGGARRRFFEARGITAVICGLDADAARARGVLERGVVARVLVGSALGECNDLRGTR